MGGARPRLRVSLVVVLAAAVVVIGFDPGLRLILEHSLRLSGVSEVRSYIRHAGAWGPVALVAVMVLHGATFVPAEVLTLAALWLYGPVWGLVYAWIGSMLSAYLSFYLARWIGRPLVARYVSDARLARLDALVAGQGARGLFILRLIPLVSFNALNYAAGLTKLTFWQYTWATGLGILPAGIVLTVLYRSVAQAHSVFVVFAVVGLLLLTVLGLRIWRQARRSPD